tara:strand:- start:497 stop:772 length:276 start_codon:yes stop_codon:yes gene_type:complete
MEQKDNSIVIFKNDKKTKENQPDYKIKMMVDGKVKEASVWIKESASGVKYMSGPIQDPYVQTDAPAPSTAQAPVSTSKKIQDATEPDDLPF